MKKLVSEQTIIEAARKGEKIIFFDAGAIITDAARDRAQQLRIRLEQKKKEGLASKDEAASSGNPPSIKAVIAIGSDHGGFQLKEQLKSFIDKLGYKTIDLGTYSEEQCDYPDYAYAVARMVALGEASKGIMIDAVGTASAIVANKLNGIRAACCYNEFSAQSSREHNNANVLTLGGRVLGAELAKSIVKIWLQTDFGGGRHQKRLEKISDIEKRSIK